MKKIAVLFLGLALSIASFGISTARAAGSATFSLSPTNTTVDTGDSFSLSVLVDPNGESLDTARVEIEFDTDMLEVTAFDLGSLFPYQSPSNEIDNSSGSLSQGAFKFGDPIEDSGTFGTVTFRALSSGDATISITSDSRLIEDGDEMIDTSELGSATITIAGDEVDAIAEEVTSDAGESTAEDEEEAAADADEEEADDSSSSESTTTDASLEAQALAYFGALTGRLPSDDDDWDMNSCIAYDNCYDEDNRDTTYEVAAIDYFNDIYDANPSEDMDWNAVHALAYTTFGAEVLGLDPLTTDDGGEAEETATEDTTEEVATEEEVASEEDATEDTTEEVATEEEEVSYVDESLSLEEQGLVYFGAFYARMPSSSEDWEALHCIAYGGCQGDPRDLQAEEDALVLFGAKYAKMPSTDIEWNVLHTIAYTDLLTFDEQGSEDVAEEEVVEEEEATTEEEVAADEEATTDEEATDETTSEEEATDEAEELTPEQEAIGWFGTLTGELPSSDEDWVAIDYMVNGYTPETQDLEAESAAITTFTDAFGALPSSDSDWNIIAAIAYSGAF